MFKNRINSVINEQPHLLPSLGAIFALADPEVIKAMADVRRGCLVEKFFVNLVFG